MEHRLAKHDEPRLFPAPRYLYNAETRTLSGCVTNSGTGEIDAQVKAMNPAQTTGTPSCKHDELHTVSAPNYLAYDAATRTLSGCVTNQGLVEA